MTTPTAPAIPLTLTCLPCGAELSAWSLGELGDRLKEHQCAGGEES